MIGNAFKLMKARKDPEAAKALAAEMLKEEVKAKTDGAIFALKLLYGFILVCIAASIVIGILAGYKAHWVFYIFAVFSGYLFLTMLKAYKAAKNQIEKAQQAAENVREKLPEMLSNRDQQKDEV